MSQGSYLPAIKEIRDLLADLLGRDIDLSPTTPLAPSSKNPTSVGVYVDDALQVTAVVVCDLAFSAYVAAAIGLVPPPTAQEAVEEGTLSLALRENLYEVLNIAASLFNVGEHTHLRLYDLHAAGDPLPGSVLVQALTLGRREDLEVEVGGYGRGRLSVVLVA